MTKQQSGLANVYLRCAIVSLEGLTACPSLPQHVFFFFFLVSARETICLIVRLVSFPNCVTRVSTLVYKWGYQAIYCWGYPCDGLTYHSRRVKILLVASCYVKQDKLRPDGPLSSHDDFTAEDILRLMLLERAADRLNGRHSTTSKDPWPCLRAGSVALVQGLL